MYCYMEEKGIPAISCDDLTCGWRALCSALNDLNLRVRKIEEGRRET
jgi:hypothetical protein